MKKFILLIILFTVTAGLIFNFGANNVKAQTTSLSQSQIQTLLDMLRAFGADASVISRVESILGGVSPIDNQTISWCHDFLIDLKYQQAGEDIKALQAALKKEGVFKGTATGYFGPITFQAVKLFQEKYFGEILAPWGFKRGTGIVGPTTRAKLNELYGCTKVSIAPALPQQGDTLVIKIKIAEASPHLPLRPSLEDSAADFPPEKVSGSLNLKKINFFKSGENLVGIFGISAKEKPGRYNLTINFPDGSQYKKMLNIIERKFPVTRLLVTKELEEKGHTPTKIQERVAQENLKLIEVLNIFTPRAYFDRAFVYPLDKIINVGAFGDIRKSGEIELQHLGVDLHADTGTPIYAINDGLVRLTADFLNYGKTMVIDHGLGIFSLYLHLDEFKAEEGKEVKRGEVIALSGNTGYSIAPHLHLGIKINRVSVDPLRFIERTKKEMIK